eukprot:Lithocolla_globosa_v1_NODE_8248_length_844_cov_5.273764.p2 type:complete len:172 gc:universal NODE_8248_length_844_cov_5.273764:250-765(+)
MASCIGIPFRMASINFSSPGLAFSHRSATLLIWSFGTTTTPLMSATITSPGTMVIPLISIGSLTDFTDTNPPVPWTDKPFAKTGKLTARDSSMSRQRPSRIAPFAPIAVALLLIKPPQTALTLFGGAETTITSPSWSESTWWKGGLGGFSEASTNFTVLAGPTILASPLTW